MKNWHFLKSTMWMIAHYIVYGIRKFCLIFFNKALFLQKKSENQTIFSFSFIKRHKHEAWKMFKCYYSIIILYIQKVPNCINLRKLLTRFCQPLWSLCNGEKRRQFQTWNPFYERRVVFFCWDFIKLWTSGKIMFQFSSAEKWTNESLVLCCIVCSDGQK